MLYPEVGTEEILALIWVRLPSQSIRLLVSWDSLYLGLVAKVTQSAISLFVILFHFSTLQAVAKSKVLHTTLDGLTAASLFAATVFATVQAAHGQGACTIPAIWAFWIVQGDVNG